MTLPTFDTKCCPARWSAHSRADLMNPDYRMGALKTALRNVVSPPPGMERVMRRGAADLIAEIEEADAMAALPGHFPNSHRADAGSPPAPSQGCDR